MENTISGQSPVQYQNNQHSSAKNAGSSISLQSVAQQYNPDDKAKKNSSGISSNLKSLSDNESGKLFKDNEEVNSEERRRRMNSGCGLFGRKRYSRRTGLYR